MAPQADFYTNAYLTTHMKRYQMALQMVQQQKQSEFMIAQMLNDQIRNLDRQIASVKGAGSSSEFNQLIKAYQLKQSVIGDATKRQIQVYDSVEDMFDVSTSLPTINNAADTFAKSLATAGSVESKARRSAGSVGGYSRGTEQAKAVAAATYSAMKADAYRNGQQIKFDANDSTIRATIAKTMNVAETDIDTVDIQKQKMLTERLDALGGATTDEATLDALIADVEARDSGAATPSGKKSAVEQLMQQRTALATQQNVALSKAQASPEAQIQQARQLYRSQFAPRATQKKQAFENYLLSLDKPQQMIALGYENTKPSQVKFMFQPRNKIAGNDAKEVAYDLFYAAQKERREGKKPSYLIHTKVEEAFPNNPAKQQEVLGYIFRATEVETGTKIEDTMERNLKIKEVAARKEAKAAKKEQDDRNLIQKGFDAFTSLFADKIQVEQPVVEPPSEEDVIFDESGGTINIQGDPEEQPPEEIPPPPAGTEEIVVAPFDKSIYTVDNPFVTKPFRKKSYSYFIKPDGSYGMIGTSGKEVDISANQQALDEADAELKKIEAAQQAPKE